MHTSEHLVKISLKFNTFLSLAQNHLKYVIVVRCIFKVKFIYEVHVHLKLMTRHTPDI